MKPKTFERFREVIYAQSGISLSEGKEALVSARVAKRLRALNLPDHEAYLALISRGDAQDELVQLLDAISTNVTSFFREPAHFEFLSNQLQIWLSQGQTRFRIWCAASSTGEEPYTLAMTLSEAFTNRRIDARILATDISTKVLKQAIDGRYEAKKTSGIPLHLRDRYFELQQTAGEKVYEASPQLKGMLTFSRLNLSQPPFPMRGPFDAVFCRNVMIYFDNAVRSRLVNEIYRLIRPGGYLMVGHSESLTGLNTPFKAIQPAVYLKS